MKLCNNSNIKVANTEIKYLVHKFKKKVLNREVDFEIKYQFQQIGTKSRLEINLD